MLVEYMIVGCTLSNPSYTPVPNITKCDPLWFDIYV